VVSRGARHAAEAQRLLDLLGRADVERAAVADALAVTRLRALPEDRRRNALRYWVVQRGHPLPDSRRLTELAGALIAARADAHPEVRWGDTIARREGNRLSLQRMRERVPSRTERARSTDVTDVSVSELADLEWFPHRATLELPAGLGRLELAPDPHGPIDLDAIPEPLTVRLRRGGERLCLTRGGPRRLLKSLLQEARIPRAERARLPLLWSGERLLAAADLWVDAAVRAQAGQRRRGRLIWHR
jgi:tRNA(Ile)-lysidine synthase